MIDVLDLFLLDTSEQLRKMSNKKEKNKLIILLYLKNVIMFLNQLQNTSLLTRTLIEIKNFVDLFTLFPKMNKNLIMAVLTIWQKDVEFPVKFYSFLLLRQIFDKNDVQIKTMILKNMINVYGKCFSEFNWRTYEVKNFMKNSMIELFTIDTSVTYPMLYDKIKQMIQFLVKVSQDKQVEKLKKL